RQKLEKLCLPETSLDCKKYDFFSLTDIIQQNSKINHPTKMPENKKILYVITKANWGGAQKYVFDLACHSQKNGFDSLVAFGQGGKLQKKLTDHNVKTIKIENLDRDISIIKDFLVFLDLLKIFTKEKPDIIHLNSSKIGGLGALAGQI